MGKIKVLSATFISVALLLLTACGNEEETSATPEKENAKPKTAETTKSEETNETEETAFANASEELNPNIAKESEGNVEILYTNKEPNYSHDMNGFQVSVDEYQIVKVTDMNQDVAIPFDDQTEGYVVTAKVTIHNTTDKAIYYNNNYRIQVSSESDYLSNDINKTFVKEEFPKSKVETETSKYAAGEKVTGLVSFTLTNAEFDSLKTVSPKFIIEGGAADNQQYKGAFLEKAIFDFTYSDEHQQEVSSQPNFYPDRMTTDNWVDKKMIIENSEINETQQLGDVKVTLDGVQYTEVIPTEANKERFRNFGDSELVALTVKLKLDNQSDAPISIWNIGSKVIIDDTRGSVLSAGLAEPSDPKEINAGEQGEKYHVFLFRKDEFEIFQKFDLEFGPFVGQDGKKLFKGESITFNLPR